MPPPPYAGPIKLAPFRRISVSSPPAKFTELEAPEIVPDISNIFALPFPFTPIPKASAFVIDEFIAIVMLFALATVPVATRFPEIEEPSAIVRSVIPIIASLFGLFICAPLPRVIVELFAVTPYEFEFITAPSPIFNVRLVIA